MTRQLGVPIAMLVVAIAAAISGCAGIAYPVPGYEEVYTKTALVTPVPDPSVAARLGEAAVARGRYLVTITGCAACHTDGALLGTPDPARGLAGSEMGIAYTNPLQGRFPGVAYPSNLTPDPDTGLGRWSDARIAGAIRGGIAGPGSAPGHLAVMPWALYQHLSDEDLNAIVCYLRSIPPVEHRVPDRVAPGTRAATPYLYFGVYRSGPAISPPAH